MNEQQCCKMIWPMGGYRSRQCGVKAKVERDGKFYCLMHDPVAKQARQDKKFALWKKEQDKERAIWEWDNAAKALCSGVDTETMKKLGSGWLENYLKLKNSLIGG